MPSFKCKDLGMACPFEASVETEEELMKKISKHAGEVHNMKEISLEMLAEVKTAIKKWFAGGGPNIKVWVDFVSEKIFRVF